MSSRISSKSDIRCTDIASLIGAMANKLCEEATVCYFEVPKTLYREYYRRQGMKFPESRYKESEEWSDCALSFINLAETGMGNMVKEVEAYNGFEQTT